MNAAALQSLSRAELQKLAKANNVKANLKSGTIIALLLERNDEGGDEEAAAAHGSFDSTRAQGPQSPRVTNPEEVEQGGVYSFSPSPRPQQFSLDSETAPEPVAEHTLRFLAKKMALISKGTEERRGGAQALHRMAKGKSDRAKEVRKLVNMMHAERVRMQNYFAHIQPVQPEWTDHGEAPVGNKHAHAPAVTPVPVTEEEEEEVDSLSVVAMLSAADDMEVDEDQAHADDVQMMPMELAGLPLRPPHTPPEQYSRGPWF
ncbi:hypothetical protein B0H21DRAFT_821940 [Amylocystis lapponica]|nr:hypothetical protein B0H21DRAFT_821940 [Amylocystis lapponica]